MTDVGFFPIIHAALMSRSNFANSNMCIQRPKNNLNYKDIAGL